jgi:hypothetical protein
MALTRLNVNAAMLNASATKDEVNRVQSVSPIDLSLLFLFLLRFLIYVRAFALSCVFDIILHL